MSALAGILDRPSPNHDARPAGAAVDMLVIHYTGMESAAAALDRLADPAARVSAHYCIDEDGTIYRMVPEARRAWHAGISRWAGREGVNAVSIGIELVNPGHEFGYRPFPEPQLAALEALARDIVARHGIPPERVLGHADVAPERRRDPGELFDWRRLARAGIGLWAEPPESRDPARPPGSRDAVLRDLAAIGYGLAIPGRSEAEAATLVVTAFQRHFRPRRVDGRIDAETAALAAALAARCRAAARPPIGTPP